MSVPATASDALQRVITGRAEVENRLVFARARLVNLTHETSHETRVRLRREIEPEIAVMVREIEDLEARQADLRRVLLREEDAADNAELAAVKVRRVKKDAELADAIARLHKVSDEQNAEARAEYEVECRIAARQHELDALDAPVSPEKLVQEATRARIIALATPAPIVGGSAPASGEPEPETESLLERAERLAGRSSHAIVAPASAGLINGLVPNAAQSQVVRA